jgi:hypothetical protein
MRRSFALVAAIVLSAFQGTAIAEPPTYSDNDRISVSTEAAPNDGLSELDIYCEIEGGVLYVDNDFTGIVPYTGSIPTGRHYIKLELPGYDDLGIWLTLKADTKYDITFTPSGQIPLFAPKDRVSVSTVPTLNAGISDFEVDCLVGGATLYIDRDLIGNALYTSGITSTFTSSFTSSIPPGSHYFEIKLPGYYDLGLWLSFEEKTKYTVIFDPVRITGRIALDVHPADAAVSIDGAAVEKNSIDIPVGSHTIAVRRFGFVQQDLPIVIRERETSVLSLELDKAPFAVTGLAFTQAVFNPHNAGSRGRTILVFHASNYASASAEIRGSKGELVATLDFPSVDTWNQSRLWDGLGADGKVLPDGVYSVTLAAKPAPDVPTQPGGQPDGTIVLKTEVQIDSSLVIRSFGTVSAVPGLLYMPDPMPQPAGTVAVEASWFEPWGEPQASAFGLSAALSIGGMVTLAFNAAAETGNSPVNGADVAGSALVSLFGDSSSPVGGAFFLKGSYSSSAAPTMPGALSAVETSFPFSIHLGYLSLALAPGALIDFASSSPSFLGLARSGLWYDGRSFTAGISGELPLSFSGGLPAPLWPAQAALEGRLMLGSTPFVAAAYVDAELAPGTAPSFGIGFGLGLLF